MLQKATGRMPHAGGMVVEPGSPAHRMLLRWIESGALLDPLEASLLRGLRVETPIVSCAARTSYLLQVAAHFAVGSTEEVTAFGTFDSRDRDVAEVDRTGQVSLRGRRFFVAGRGSPRLVAGDTVTCSSVSQRFLQPIDDRVPQCPTLRRSPDRRRRSPWTRPRPAR